MTNEVLQALLLKVIISSFATVGVLEYLKNFLKTKKTWIYSIIMPFIGVGCYLSCEYLPIWVIGCILTVGFDQLDYQIIVQGFKKILNKTIDKITSKEKNDSGEQ